MEQTTHQTMAKVYAIGGGKGGVGKSTVSSGIAASLARTGRRVLLVDGDVTQGALHVYLGQKHAPIGIREFFGANRAKLKDYLTKLPGIPFDFLSAGQETLGMNRLPLQRIRRLVNNLKALDYDDIVLDLAAGSAPLTADLFASADHRFLVTTPDPAAVLAAFAFFKTALFRAYAQNLSKDNATGLAANAMMAKLNVTEAPSPSVLDALSGNEEDSVSALRQAFASRILVNLANEEEGVNTARALSKVAMQRLGVQLSLAGALPRDPGVAKALRKRQVWFDEGRATLTVLAKHLKRRPAEDLPQRTGLRHCSIGFNEEFEYRSHIVHVQTEDLGFEQNELVTLVYQGGRILFKVQRAFDGDDDDKNGRNNQVSRQHFAVVKGIRAGRLDEKLGLGMGDLGMQEQVA